MKDDHISLGQLGENLACDYLAEKRYKILSRNFRRPWGEIDIVARARDGTLVFFEVKTMRDFGDGGLRPEDQMSSAKLRKLRRTCAAYCAERPEDVYEERGWRIDVLAISMPNNTDARSVRQYENI